MVVRIFKNIINSNSTKHYTDSRWEMAALTLTLIVALMRFSGKITSGDLRSSLFNHDWICIKQATGKLSKRFLWSVLINFNFLNCRSELAFPQGTESKSDTQVINSGNFLAPVTVVIFPTISQYFLRLISIFELCLICFSAQVFYLRHFERNQSLMFLSILFFSNNSLTVEPA